MGHFNAMRSVRLVVLALAGWQSGMVFAQQAGAGDADPLPSWEESVSKAAIVAFVTKVTRVDSPTFVPVAERVAVFDNDGTLWSERPAYFQLMFTVDRVRQLAPQHPEWENQQPFQAALDGDLEALAQSGAEGLTRLLMVTHAGMTSDEFSQTVKQWLATARHPRFDRPYQQLVFQPMLELLEYLRAHGFKTFIVSGGGVDFIRVFAEEVYGIPPEQTIGSSIKMKLEMRDGHPVIVRLPEIDFINDKAGKPIGIQKVIGRRPLAAFGNSDGDLQMLQYTAAGSGPRFCMIVHHTDSDREWKYDRDSHVGRLDKALEEARQGDWSIVDMRRDWRVVYPRER